MSDTENILRKVLDKIRKEHDFGNFKLEIKPANSGGANYTSVLYLVTVKCPEKDVELFAKVACMGDYMREVVGAKRMYELEVFFYTELIKVYQALELKATIEDFDKFIVPKFYGCDTKLNEETVVLQNMVAEGYGPYDRLISLDWEHAASSIQELAKFHALSFAYQKENPTEYEEVCKELVFVEMKNDDPIMKETWEKQYIPRSLNVVREEHRPRILKLLERLGDDVVWRFKKPLGVKVICHGDFRPSNLLYKRKDNSVHAIVVDYQTIHVGSPAADFVYFLLSGTDSAFRAEHYDRLVEHYYRELSAATQRLGVDVTEAYPREVFDSELKEMLPLLVILGIFLLPIVLVDAEQAPKVDGDGGIEAFAIPSNKLYAERFSGIVEDCVRWGAL